VREKMSTDDTVVARSPNAFTEDERQDLMAMVRAGGVVGDAVLEENVRNAKCLVIAGRAACLVGVAALKILQASHRQYVKARAGAPVEAKDFPFELGYVFVLPSARRKGLGLTLCRAALDPAAGRGVFATARTEESSDIAGVSFGVVAFGGLRGKAIGPRLHRDHAVSPREVSNLVLPNVCRHGPARDEQNGR
jgi:GNAT superfamily N-acetyltransferase